MCNRLHELKLEQLKPCISDFQGTSDMGHPWGISSRKQFRLLEWVSYTALPWLMVHFYTSRSNEYCELIWRLVASFPRCCAKVNRVLDTSCSFHILVVLAITKAYIHCLLAINQDRATPARLAHGTGILCAIPNPGLALQPGYMRTVYTPGVPSLAKQAGTASQGIRK
jgi:hypothetical protein